MGNRLIKTRLICPICGNIQTIVRRNSKQKKFGHLKYLWCYKCQQRINHFELKDERIEDIERKM